MIKKSFKHCFLVKTLLLIILFIGVNSLLPLNIFAYSVETEDPAVFEENSWYKISDSELMRISKDKVEGLWLPAEPKFPGPKGIPVDDPEAMVSDDGEYIPSEFQRFEGLGLPYVAPNEGLFLKYLKKDKFKTVFPPDDRVNILDTTVFPWRTIVKLWITTADGSKRIGSGAIIDDFHVLTAGHCVWSHDYGNDWAQSIQVVPGLDGYYKPFNHAWATNIRSYDGWTQNADPDHDWAVITLDRNIGTWTGWMGRECHPDLSWYAGKGFNTAGYPADLFETEMYFDADIADHATKYLLFYYMDTYGGQSGSPIWRYYNISRWINAIVTYETPAINIGTRLNQDKFDRIITWLNSDIPPTDYADLIDDGQAWSGFSPAEVWTGDSFSVWNDVRNVGTEHSGSFTVSYYCSTDTTCPIIISESDYLIGTCSVSSISPFSWDDSSWDGSFPSNIPTGVYSVGWIIDSYDDVTEFDEDNNTMFCFDATLTVHYVPPTYPPQVTTNQAYDITSTFAKLSGHLDSTGNLTCQVWFEYGKTTSYGSSTPKLSRSTVGPFSAGISLSPNTTYHFRACASNSKGTAYGKDITFTTLPGTYPPKVTTNKASNITSTSAQLNGNLDSTGDLTCKVWFEYGKTTSYGSSTPIESKSSVGSFKATIKLDPKTTYHFRACASNGKGTVYGKDITFTTPADTYPPKVTTNQASDITSTSAQLNGNLDSTGNLSCMVWFEYGKTTSYGSSTPKRIKSGVAPFSEAISSLDPNTTYHFRACASNSKGTAYGKDITFTTPSGTYPPKVTTNQASDITSTSAQLNGNLDSTGDLTCKVWFEYGKTTSYGSSTPKRIKSGVGSFKAIIKLDPKTTYHFRAWASNSKGTAYGDDITFGGPLLPNLELTPPIQSVTVGNQANINVVVEDVTDLRGANINLDFDASKLQYISSAAAGFIPNATLLASSTSGSVTLDIAGLGEFGYHSGMSTGTIITVVFERIATGNTNITFGATELRDKDNIFITHSTGSGCLITSLPGDFGGPNNGPPDGAIDFEDLMIFAMAYGTTPADANWNPVCDIAGDGGVLGPDGKIDFEDLMVFAMNYGKTCADL